MKGKHYYNVKEAKHADGLPPFVEIITKVLRELIGQNEDTRRAEIFFDNTQELELVSHSP